LTSSEDCSILLWDLQKSKLKRKFRGHEDVVLSINSHHSEIWSGGFDRTVKYWNENTGECKKTIPLKDRIWKLQSSKNNGNRLAIGLGGITETLILLEKETQKIISKITPFNGHRSAVYDLQFVNQDDLLASASHDGSIKFWDFRKESPCVMSMDDPDDNPLYRLQVDEPWRLIVGTARFGIIRVWDWRMPRCLSSSYVDSKYFRGIYSLQADHGKLFVTSSTALYLLDFTPK